MCFLCFYFLFACLLLFASDLSQISLLLLVKSKQWLTHDKFGVFATQSSLVHISGLTNGTENWVKKCSFFICLFVCHPFKKKNPNNRAHDASPLLAFYHDIKLWGAFVHKRDLIYYGYKCNQGIAVIGLLHHSPSKIRKSRLSN